MGWVYIELLFIKIGPKSTPRWTMGRSTLHRVEHLSNDGYCMNHHHHHYWRWWHLFFSVQNHPCLLESSLESDDTADVSYYYIDDDESLLMMMSYRYTVSVIGRMFHTGKCFGHHTQGWHFDPLSFWVFVQKPKNPRPKRLEDFWVVICTYPKTQNPFGSCLTTTHLIMSSQVK